MALFGKDHYDLMTQFEKSYSHCRLDREPKDNWASGNVYQDGQTNALFLAYLAGYSYGALRIILEEKPSDGGASSSPPLPDQIC